MMWVIFCLGKGESRNQAAIMTYATALPCKKVVHDSRSQINK